MFGAVRSRISGLGYSLGGMRAVAPAPRLWAARSIGTAVQRSLRSGATAAVMGSVVVRRYGTDASSAQLQHWINAYRQHGHKRAGLDPLHETKIPDVKELDASAYGFDASQTVDASHFYFLGGAPTSVANLKARLEATYCGPIGLDVNHIRSEDEKSFLYNAFESVTADGGSFDRVLTAADKRNVHSLLVQSEVFDHFLGVKFGSFKRYALEGAETMLPGVEAVFRSASAAGITDVVIGMPHRGRFNVLVSLLDYPARGLFAKIKGMSHIPKDMDGHCDVASHIACSTTRKYDGQRPLHVTMLHNPSHLEAVNPVSQGKTRAKMDSAGDAAGDRHLCLQLHGDAAFSGQGIVPEALALSQLPGFTVGGAVHIIVNNQIGFTTTKENGRSSLYASDVARIVDCPVIHVNGENPEAVVYACRVAVQFRMKFRKDILIDLIAYRRHGHNEVDEPAFTQPKMYQNVRSRKSVVDAYTAKLKAAGLLTDASLAKLLTALHTHLEEELTAAAKFAPQSADFFAGKWKGYGQPSGRAMHTAPQTGVDLNTLSEVAAASVALPADFAVHQRLARAHIEPRLKSVASGSGLDWATAEALAMGSLVRQGFSVRLVGQDVQRGTFSQRHCLFVDQKTERHFAPFAHTQWPGAGRFAPINSNLSEFAVLCYEYGYNIDSPKTLNIWEAQFGDFFNGAQIAIDTFVACSETKWLRANGLILLLPHGFDGAGPEHSSCRIERFLQLCEGNALSTAEAPVNMCVANISTPANYFHALRRQMLRPFRRPLVIASPKTLLRHTQAVSTLAEMGPGTSFVSVLPDPSASAAAHAAEVRTIAVTSGKIAFDLAAERDAQKRNDIALVRVEELSPFPFAALSAELTRLATASKAGVVRVVWSQEEPQNAGAYSFVAPRLQNILSGSAHPALNKIKAQYTGRPDLPLPAVGSGVAHKVQADRVVKDLFALKY